MDRSDICGESLRHKWGCPYFDYPKSGYMCKLCGEDIQYGDLYIEHDGEYAHRDCFEDNYELVDFLGCEVKKMSYEN